MTELNTVVSLVNTVNASLANNTQGETSGSSPRLGIAILSIAFFIGFPGNAFIIWTVLTRIKKRTVTCILILHLAIADIIVIITAPFFIHLLSNGYWMFGPVICKSCHYIGCLSMYASIFLITFMSLDRFLAVAIPFSSQKIRTKRVANRLILAIWLLAAVLAIPMPFYRVIILLKNRALCIPYHSSSKHIVFQYLFESLFGFFIPFSIIVFCYVYIGLRLQSAQFQSKRKTSRLVIFIIVTFALFWIPYQSVNILQVLGETLSDPNTKQMLRRAALSARPNVTALAFLSSSVNPILYVFAGGSFIRSAGIGFMAKLFEGTASEVSSFRTVSQVFRQRSRNESVEMGKRGEVAEESKTFSTNPTEY
ncbi:leukotriene B4 receptor 1-like [Spea bombifrons]|uniref:leukotriene B4 receptor 1-like n=1 Tax=Spea bombifrons TaxID=233779 RepID=UPI0023499D34|nr:leukotriene B4 receptor 1-like [Spea bombifrons]